MQKFYERLKIAYDNIQLGYFDIVANVLRKNIEYLLKRPQLVSLSNIQNNTISGLLESLHNEISDVIISEILDSLLRPYVQRLNSGSHDNNEFVNSNDAYSIYDAICY